MSTDPSNRAFRAELIRRGASRVEAEFQTGAWSPWLAAFFGSSLLEDHAADLDVFVVLKSRGRPSASELAEFGNLMHRISDRLSDEGVQLRSYRSRARRFLGSPASPPRLPLHLFVFGSLDEIRSNIDRAAVGSLIRKRCRVIVGNSEKIEELRLRFPAPGQEDVALALQPVLWDAFVELSSGSVDERHLEALASDLDYISKVLEDHANPDRVLHEVESTPAKEARRRPCAQTQLLEKAQALFALLDRILI